MRTFISFALILTITFAASIRDDANEVTLAKEILECVRKTFDGGLPSANIPNHNPYVLNNNITVPLDLIFAAGEISLVNVTLDEMIDFNLTKIESVPENNPAGVYFNYELLWPRFSLEGDYSLEIYGFINDTGHVRFEFSDLLFSGNLNMTASTADTPDYLDSIWNIISVNSTDVTTTDSDWDWLIDQTGPAITNLINTGPNDDISKYLKTQLNEDWLSNGTRIDAIWDYCFN